MENVGIFQDRHKHKPTGFNAGFATRKLVKLCDSVKWGTKAFYGFVRTKNSTNK